MTERQFSGEQLQPTSDEGPRQPSPERDITLDLWLTTGVKSMENLAPEIKKVCSKILELVGAQQGSRQWQALLAEYFNHLIYENPQPTVLDFLRQEMGCLKFVLMGIGVVEGFRVADELVRANLIERFEVLDSLLDELSESLRKKRLVLDWVFKVVGSKELIDEHVSLIDQVFIVANWFVAASVGVRQELILAVEDGKDLLVLDPKEGQITRTPIPTAAMVKTFADLLTELADTNLVLRDLAELSAENPE